MTTNTEGLVRIPRSLDEVGLPESLLTDLVLRRVLLDGRTSIARLSGGLKLTAPLIEFLLVGLREKKLIEFEGMVGRDYIIVLTEAGRTVANDRTRACAYAGAAPVSLDHYSMVVRSQQPRLALTRSTIAQAFEDLVIEPQLIDELGPSMMTKGAVFLYGPPGTGKSSIAERMIRAYGDFVYVPYSVEVDGQIIVVFDPTVHVPAREQPTDIDARWVRCQRPCVISGGELQAHQLDLSSDPRTGIYLAPLQMKANNGMFVIDDFGRQSMTPAQLLNRWIVPLDRGIDYLSLDTGVKFQVPFNVKVVFSTNLPPAALGDEAFFRRLQSKVFIGPIHDNTFDEIVRRVAKAKGVAFTSEDSKYLRSLTRSRGDGDLRPYVPAVVCEILHQICLYENLPLIMNQKALDRVAGIYFTDLTGERPHPTASAATPPSLASPDAATPPAVTPPERQSMPPLTVNDAELAADMAAMRSENWTAF